MKKNEAKARVRLDEGVAKQKMNPKHWEIPIIPIIKKIERQERRAA